MVALMVPVVYCDPDCDRKISTNGLAGAGGSDGDGHDDDGDNVRKSKTN